MVCALFQLGGDRALHVVVAEQDATDRARLIAHAYAHDVCNTVGRHAPRMKHGVEVVRTRNVRNARRRGVWIAAEIGVRNVAAPGYLRVELRHALHESASPHHLQSALAAAKSLDIPVVPLGTRLKIIVRTHDTHRHVVEVCVRRSGVLRRRERIALGVVVEIPVVLVVVIDHLVAMRIHKEADTLPLAKRRQTRTRGNAAVTVELSLNRQSPWLCIPWHDEPTGHGARAIAGNLRGIETVVVCRRRSGEHLGKLGAIHGDCRKLGLGVSPERIEVGRLNSGKLHLLGRNARAAAEGDLLPAALFNCLIVGTCKIRVHAHDARDSETRLHKAPASERNRIGADHTHVIVRRAFPDYVELLVLQRKRQCLDAGETEVEPDRLVLYVVDRILFVCDRLEAKVLDISAGTDLSKRADRETAILNRVVRRLDPFRRTHDLGDAHLVDLATERVIVWVFVESAKDKIARTVGHYCITI